MSKNADVEFDPTISTGYMRLGQPGRRVARTVDHGGGALADYDAHGRIIGVEAIGTDLLTAAFRVLTERSDGGERQQQP